MVASYTAVAGTRANAADVNASLRNGPAVACYNSAGVSIPNATLTALTWNTELYDSDAMHSTASNTSRFTCIAGFGGVYSFKAAIQWAAGSGAREMYFRVNGAGRQYGDAYQDVSTGGLGLFSTSADIALVAGDYVELIVYQNSGGALNACASTSSSMSAHYVRTTP